METRICPSALVKFRHGCKALRRKLQGTLAMFLIRKFAGTGIRGSVHVLLHLRLFERSPLAPKARTKGVGGNRKKDKDKDAEFASR